VTNPVVSLTVVKSSVPPSGSTVALGSTVAYSLVLTNTGTAIASDVTVTDTVPTGATYVASSASCGGAPGCTVAESNGVITWSNLSIGPGAANAVTITFQVTVNSTDTGGQVITNVATFTNEGTPNCTTATCSTNKVTVVVRASSPSGGTTTTTTPARQTSPVTGATTVHTGEPFAGSARFEAGFAGIGFGLILMGWVVGYRRRRRTA
jgi:uncharacterized repeat protein (TIGR01451 family)